tara:strand:+ start:407 stop:868 length:462 start_codon:yes stop_codon:yes gene_type:complete
MDIDLMSSKQAKILLLNGPNLNLLGTREPGIYGSTTLADIEKRLTDKAQLAQVTLHCFQSNHEGHLIDRIHQAIHENVKCIIFNPGAFTHTSVALRDAVTGSKIPMIEVHISAVFQRETFRHTSFFADIALSRLVGFGPLGYDYALDVALTQV